MDRHISSLIRRECNCLALRSAARSAARQYDEAFRPLDLNNGQFSMLVAVFGLQPASIQALSEMLGMDRTTVTAALKPLQRRALVTLDVGKRDQRIRHVSITLDGETLLEKALPIWRAAQEDLANRVGGESSASRMREHLAAVT